VQANGFFGSRGVSRFIPPAYTHFTEQFYNEIEREAERKSRRSDGSAGDTAIELREWRREGWTYHAKGASHPFHADAFESEKLNGYSMWQGSGSRRPCSTRSRLPRRRQRQQR
jgi:hypothetical protein